MKKISGIIFVFYFLLLFSVKADAENRNGVVLQKKQPVPSTASQPQPRNVQPVAQWVSSPVLQPHTQGNLANQQLTSSNDASQELKQFSQDTQQEFANFRKL